MSRASVAVDAKGRGLVVTSANGRAGVAAAIGAAVPPITGRAAGSGVLVSWQHAPRLTTLNGLDLQWKDEAVRALENRRAVARSAPSVIAATRAVGSASTDALRAAIGPDSLSVDLDDHQVRNVAIMTIADGWGACIFDEQGTGKTVTLLAAFDRLVEQRIVDTVLVVSPKSMVAEWKAEFERYTGNLYSVALGSAGNRRAALASGADVVVLNYESAISGTDDIVRFCRRRRVALVVDESFAVKNPDARRTVALNRIREWCTRAYVLCGTPAPNRPSDVVSQFDLVDFGRTFDGLAQTFPDLEAERLAISDAMTARGIYTRNIKATVLPHLPTREFTELFVDLAPDQQRRYDTAVAGLAEEVAGIDDDEFRRRIPNFLERRIALLRICSNPVGLDPAYTETPAKLAALDALVDTYLGAGDKILIWSYYRASLDAIADRYSARGLVRIDGTIADNEERRSAVRRFQTDDEVRVFVGNPAAAGAGLTLHAGRVAVYESLSNQAAHHMQSLDRIHRRGQTREVDYVTLLARDTIEPREYQRLLDKATRQADLLGDPGTLELTRSAFLSDLTDEKR